VIDDRPVVLSRGRLRPVTQISFCSGPPKLQHQAAAHSSERTAVAAGIASGEAALAGAAFTTAMKAQARSISSGNGSVAARPRQFRRWEQLDRSPGSCPNVPGPGAPLPSVPAAASRATRRHTIRGSCSSSSIQTALQRMGHRQSRWHVRRLWFVPLSERGGASIERPQILAAKQAGPSFQPPSRL